VKAFLYTPPDPRKRVAQFFDSGKDSDSVELPKQVGIRVSPEERRIGLLDLFELAVNFFFRQV
jgi:hypothetical protein